MAFGGFVLLGDFMAFIWITLSVTSFILFVCKAKLFPGCFFLASSAAFAFYVAGTRTVVQTVAFVSVAFFVLMARLTAYVRCRVAEYGEKTKALGKDAD